MMVVDGALRRPRRASAAQHCGVTYSQSGTAARSGRLVCPGVARAAAPVGHGRALADFPGMSTEIGLREKTDILVRIAGLRR